MKWAIIDLDGSISDCSWRRLFALDAKLEKDPEKRNTLWGDFHERCIHDPPHQAEVDLVKAWADRGHGVAYITGRTEPYREMTEVWLARLGLPTSPLLMRSVGNFRSTAEYKQTQLNRFLTQIEIGDVVSWFLEDNDAVVRAWREKGYTCLQPRSQEY